MGLFENWPYTNFHELNLDWIVKRLRAVEDIREEAASSAASAAASASSASRSAADAKRYAESIVRRNNYILIGDSYAEGYTPDGNVTSWQVDAENSIKLGDPSATVTRKYAGGYGFATPQNFTDLLAQVASSTSVGCIVAAGGFNDKNYTKEQIYSGIEEFCTYAREHFPNARILIGACGWITAGLTKGVHAGVTYDELIKVIEEYKRACTRFNVEYIKGIEYSLYKKEFFSSDYVHPNDNGNFQISFAVINAINGSNQFINEYLTKVWAKIEPGSTVEFDENDGDIVTTVDPNASTVNVWARINTARFTNNPTLKLNSFFPNQNPNITGGIRIGAIHSPALMDSTPIYLPCQMIIKHTVNGSLAYVQAPGNVVIYNRTVYLTGIKLSDAGDDFVSVTNVTEIQVRQAFTTAPLLYTTAIY